VIERSAEGYPKSFFGVHQDITSRKQAEMALQESEERFRAITETAKDLIFCKDLDLKYTWVNPAMQRMFGRSLDQIVGKTVHDLVDGELADIIGDADVQTITGRTFETERTVVIGGQERTIHAIRVPLRDSSGRVTGLCGYARDTTERRRVGKWIEGLNHLMENLLDPGSSDEKLKRITDGVIEIFDADFCRIWITTPGDLCDSGCTHAQVLDGPHACHYRDRCLHLVASSGRYTHIDGEVHRRVPFGAYKIGRVASGDEPKFITTSVTEDPRIHDREWAEKLGLISFAGYRLLSGAGTPIGVLALFSKHIISSDEDRLLESLANTTAQVIQVTKAEDALVASEERHRALISQMLNGFALHEFIFDETGKPIDYRFLDINSAFEEMTGRTEDEIIGKTVLEVFPQTEQYWIETYAAVALSGKSTRFENYFRELDKHFEVLAYSPEKGKFATVFTEITERVAAEKALKLTQFSIDRAGDAAFWMDADARIFYVNDEACRSLGYSRTELLSMNVYDIAPEFNAEEWSEQWDELKERSSFMFESRLQTRDGEVFPVEIRVNYVEFDGVEYNCAYVRDITERKQADEKIRKMAFHDSLTGLPNRRLFNDRINIALSHAQRYQQKLAVMLIDLDHFKEVNDTLGHDVGDKLLQVVGKRLTDVLREGDTVARMGGDEFMLLLPGLSNTKDVNHIGWKILKAFQKPFTFNDHEIQITTSIGIAIYPDDGQDYRTLRENADVALYHAKDEGRNNFQRYQSEP
jgi:diguanylate cyclase (GGDEF)-like protein/PAS domain S-box-containing protein